MSFRPTWPLLPGKARGAVVVLQEIFGVNAHIRAVTDSFAAEGYTAIAPSLFDRVRRGIQLGYGPEDKPAGDRHRGTSEARRNHERCGGGHRRSQELRPCWRRRFLLGRRLAYLAACDLPVACAVVYYGKIWTCWTSNPSGPVMYHFGSLDKSIPVSDAEKIAAAYRTARSICMKAPTTDSTATSARPTTRKPPRWHANVPSNSSPAT